MIEKTSFQRLHLQRLHDEFDVNIEPTTNLTGEEQDAWINLAEDALAAKLHAELRVLTKMVNTEARAARELCKKRFASGGGLVGRQG
ncbi:MAG: hypothetical protein IT466_05675 [Moraxellaceae bacterium]|nr:hypothetical protein [Moraxellaceae bacterium]